MFFLVTWKQFIKRRMSDMSEITKGEDGATLLNEMKTFNGRKRLTTSDYRVYNLTEMLENKSLEISEKIASE